MSAWLISSNPRFYSLQNKKCYAQKMFLNISTSFTTDYQNNPSFLISFCKKNCIKNKNKKALTLKIEFSGFLFIFFVKERSPQLFSFIGVKLDLLSANTKIRLNFFKLTHVFVTVLREQKPYRSWWINLNEQERQQFVSKLFFLSMLSKH